MSRQAQLVRNAGDTLVIQVGRSVMRFDNERVSIIITVKVLYFISVLLGSTTDSTKQPRNNFNDYKSTLSCYCHACHDLDYFQAEVNGFLMSFDTFQTVTHSSFSQVTNMLFSPVTHQFF